MKNLLVLFTMLSVIFFAACSGVDPVEENNVLINAVNFPDTNFLMWLLEQDFAIDGKITDSEIDTIKEIDVSKKEIKDLTGIETFVALEYLNCRRNAIEQLNVSENIKLKTLHCEENYITKLDLPKTNTLTHLYCFDNRLSELDVSNNPELILLHCYENQLTTLNVSANIKLSNLNCHFNFLTSLDVTDLPLKTLNVMWNYMTSIYDVIGFKDVWDGVNNFFFEPQH